jgi:signal transduction histidine kinase
MDARQQLHLLIVEDDEIDREVLRRLLGASYRVEEAETAARARALIEAQRPDCVILDYRLPDASGLALVPELAEQFIPVILSTGEENPRVIVESMQQGAQDYLVKGRLTKEALERAIHNAVEKVELRRHLAEQRDQLVDQAHRLAESNRQVRALASALALAEQRERRRIAEILHDHVQQMLYGVQMRTFLIGMDMGGNHASDSNSSPLHDHLAEMEELLNDAIQTTRTLTVELSPPVLKSEGLGAAFSWLANQMRKMHDLSVELHIAADYRLSSEDLRVLIFHLVRELLFNVVKHSQVNHAHLSMHYQGGSLTVEVRDEGVGFDPSNLSFERRLAGVETPVMEGNIGERAADGSGVSQVEPPGPETSSSKHIGGSSFGLSSIRERLSLFDGDMRIESAPGKGTRIVIELPVSDISAE